MMDDQEKRRYLEEQFQNPQKRIEKSNTALSVSWWVAGVLLLGLIVISAL